MKRVASLYLPDWSIDRLRRAEPALAPSPERRIPLDLAAIKAASDAEQGGKQCDSPKNTGWRPGARWARTDDADAVARPLAGVDEVMVERVLRAVELVPAGRVVSYGDLAALVGTGTPVRSDR